MSLRGSARRREIQLAYLLLAPALLLLLTVLAYPVGWELWTSFTDLSPLSDGPQAFVGFELAEQLHHFAHHQERIAVAGVPPRRGDALTQHGEPVRGDRSEDQGEGRSPIRRIRCSLTVRYFGLSTTERTSSSSRCQTARSEGV